MVQKQFFQLLQCYMLALHYCVFSMDKFCSQRDGGIQTQLSKVSKSPLSLSFLSMTIYQWTGHALSQPLRCVQTHIRAKSESSVIPPLLKGYGDCLSLHRDRLKAVRMRATDPGNDQHDPAFVFDLQDFGVVFFEYEINADVLHGYRLKHCCRKIR